LGGGSLRKKQRGNKKTFFLEKLKPSGTSRGITVKGAEKEATKGKKLHQSQTDHKRGHRRGGVARRKPSVAESPRRKGGVWTKKDQGEKKKIRGEKKKDTGALPGGRGVYGGKYTHGLIKNS